MSVPKELNYSQLKPVSADSKPDILRVRSDNASYRSRDTIRIAIPTGRSGMHLFPHSTYLEGKVSLNVTTLNTPAVNAEIKCKLDQCVYSLFRRMWITHGSYTLEDQLYCNRNWNAIYDLQKNQQGRVGDTIHLLNSDDAVDTTKKGLTFTYIKTTATGTADTGDTVAVDFCVVLPSALIGSLAQKALPLSLMGASDLYLNLELEDGTVAFTREDTNTTSINYFTLSEIYLNYKVSILPNDIERALLNSTGGRVLLPATSYKGELKSISAGSSTFNDKFSFQFSSLKAITFFTQNSTNANGLISGRSVSSRPRSDLSEYYLTVNGVQMPTQAIKGFTRSYMEVLRAFDVMNDTNACGILNRTNYSSGSGADAAETKDAEFRFIGGLDMDRFNHSSDVQISGTNTLGSSLNLNLTFGTTTPAGLNLYSFAMHDISFEVDNGQMMVNY